LVKAPRRWLLVLLALVFVMTACTSSLVAFNSSVTESDAYTGTSRDLIPVISESKNCLAVYPDGTMVIKAYRMTENGPVEMTRQTYILYLDELEANYAAEMQKAENFLLSTSDKPAAPPTRGGDSFTWYSQRGSIASYHKTSQKTRISNYVMNSTTNPVAYSVYASKTQGATASISLSAGDKNTLQSITGYPFIGSYTFSQTISCVISPGYTGWIEFYPIMYNSWGYLQDGYTIGYSPFYMIYAERFVDVYYPIELGNGMLDGVFEVKQGII